MNAWRKVKTREMAKIPDEYGHLILFGVADRNIEWWLAIDRGALARELDCRVEDIPGDEPHLSRFVKRRFGLTERETREAAKKRVRRYVLQASLRPWIRDSDSFEAFYDEARSWAAKNGCSLPNELEA